MVKNRGKRLTKYIADYVVFDLETTGVRQGLDRIIEISAIKVRGHEMAEQYTTLADPEMHIPKGATAVNGITDDMVKGAPRIKDAVEGFLNFIGNDILVGHNIHTFDLNFICDAAMETLGADVKNDYIDTLYLSRKCLPQLSRHRLTDVSEHFGISIQGAHRALNDCIMNQQCYEELGKILQKIQPVSQDIRCPLCGADMIKRSGKYGEFYGCSSFPGCRGTRKI